jgi:MoaA/NifB/PqqE/SkfB family radical SAM enzyme
MSASLSLLKRIMKTKAGRNFLISKYKDRLYRSIVEKQNSYPKEVQLKKYHFLVSLSESIKRNIDKGYISERFIDKTLDTLVKHNFTDKHLTKDKLDAFKEKYGVLPPSFTVISPTKRCNLSCLGCYASSDNQCISLPFKTLDKIVDEIYNEWSNRYMTISGGEPLLYKDGEKTLFDIWKKYDEMFFNFYTNGTLVTKDIAKKLGDLGNVSPGISIEGWEKETDARRGNGTFKKIIGAFENLRQEGVLFGVSATASQNNIDVLFDEGFYDFLFKEQGASYMWMFHLMPIGKAKDAKELMITSKQRVSLYRVWEKMIEEKRYAIADFWNSGVLSDGCIAYGRNGGYLYIDWNGNIMPCVFVPYHEHNIIELHKSGNKLADALFSDLFVNGRKWQDEYGLCNTKEPNNWLMPCSIRDHYEIFKHRILSKNAKPENDAAKEAIESEEYEKFLIGFDKELEELTKPIWEKEYIEESSKDN